MPIADLPILSIITFLPAFGAAFILLTSVLARAEDAPRIAVNARFVALFVSLVAFAASLWMLGMFDPADPGFQFVEEAAWLGGGVTYKMGVDGISVLLVILTTFLMPLCILASWRSIERRVAEYMVAFLLLETLMIGVFCALDVILFYLFFEGGLIPMFIIIGVWGGANRVYAAFKFFLYTLLGSVLMLVAIIAMYLISANPGVIQLDCEALASAIAVDAPARLQEAARAFDCAAWNAGAATSEVSATGLAALQETRILPYLPTTDIEALYGGGVFEGVRFAQDFQIWLWLAFFASFAVKMPMWPVHTWLPDAHVEAPTAGSVILAGVLLKMGGYGFLRFSLPMFPDASVFFAPFVFALSVIAIIYTSLVAFRQTDVKKLIAYSSVAHMGFVTMGLFAMNAQGVQGAIFQMLSHGVISGALFLCVGVIYDRMHTREIAFYGGLVNRMPIYAAVFMLFTLGNVGLPGTSGFVGEFLTLAGAFQAATWVAFGAAFGVILSAVYALTLYRKVVYGEIVNAKLSAIDDMVGREMVVFAPLILATLALGIYPAFITDVTAASVDALLAKLAAVQAAP